MRELMKTLTALIYRYCTCCCTHYRLSLDCGRCIICIITIIQSKVKQNIILFVTTNCCSDIIINSNLIFGALFTKV